MTLTEKQKSINSNVEYWKWFRQWWRNDYSINGSALSVHYDIGGVGSYTLKDWWQKRTSNITSFADRQWTDFHLPEHDLDGNLSIKHKISQPFSMQPRSEVRPQWSDVKFKNFQKEIIGIVHWAIQAGSPLHFNGIWLPAINNTIVHYNDSKEFADKPIWMWSEFSYNLGVINFNKAKFHESAEFKNNFFRATGFYNSIFSGAAELSNCIFEVQGNFFNAIFEGEVNFQRTLFLNKAMFEKTQFLSLVNFTEAVFRKEVQFQDAKFMRRSNFSGAEFQGLPLFHRAQLSEETSFFDAKFKVDENIPPQNYENAFRVLQNQLLKINARDEAFRFSRYAFLSRLKRKPLKSFFGELKRDRLAKANKFLKNDEVTFSEVMFLSFYKNLSDFGQSISKPIRLLIVLFVLMFIIQSWIYSYDYNTCFTLKKGCALDYEAMRLGLISSLKFSFPPVSTITTLFGDEVYFASKNLSFNKRLLLSIMLGIQAFLSSVFVFLIGLGIKRRLQIR